MLPMTPSNTPSPGESSNFKTPPANPSKPTLKSAPCLFEPASATGIQSNLESGNANVLHGSESDIDEFAGDFLAALVMIILHR
jgi:hypothetical protein